MQRHKKPLPALAVIEKKPHRKSRSETILRLLIGSSYPHALASNISVLIARGLGTYDEDSISQAAVELRDRETTLSPFDFIRCIEIDRNEDKITILAKRLNDVNIKKIVDNGDHHEVLIDVCLEHDNCPISQEQANELGRLLLATFWKSKATRENKHRDVSTVNWLVAEPKLEVDNTTNLKGFRFNTVKSVKDYEAVLEQLTFVLTETIPYRIMLTQNAIIIKDRGIRINVDPNL